MNTNMHLFIILRSVLFRMRNASDRNCRENQNTRFILSYLFFFFENRTVYEIMWKNIVDWGRPQIDSIAHALCMLDT